MVIRIIRVLFVIGCGIMGGIWAVYILNAALDRSSFWYEKAIGVALGMGVSLLVLFLLRFVTQEVFERIYPSLIAISLALVFGFTLGQWLINMYFEHMDSLFKTFLVCSLVLIFGFIGVSLGLTRAANWETLIRAVQRKSLVGVSPKIVDTSVIIDGRIADICATGFIEGVLVVPRFVLKELQNIADSSDVLRRARGRRGLDILHALQEPDSKVTVHIIEDDPQDLTEVDEKLVRVARQYNAKILTNDLNLNKVAQIEGVPVLNINDLANALKPAVLPDEFMKVKIVKEGKESFQGVGYLDDGTMVVVDGGRDFVGKDVTVIVTSVLQTSAGRMIFSKLQSVLT